MDYCLSMIPTGCIWIQASGVLICYLFILSVSSALALFFLCPSQLSSSIPQNFMQLYNLANPLTQFSILLNSGCTVESLGSIIYLGWILSIHTFKGAPS